MTIERLTLGGARNRTIKYAVCTDARENGGKREELIRLDTLETATNVLRYINGYNLTREQIADAIQAIRAEDAKNRED